MTLPPLPSPDRPDIHVHSQRRGRLEPLSRAAISQQLQDGSLRPEDLFWFSGMEGWAKLGDHPDLPAASAAPAPAPAPAAAATEQPSSGSDIQPTDAREGALARAENSEQDNALDAVFGKLVAESWRYHSQHEYAGHIDEVMVGAVITSCLEGGRSLIDLSSDGTHHYMRFEDFKDHSRLIVRLTHLTGSLIAAAVQGHRVAAVIGYGEKLRNFSQVWQAVRSEYQSGIIARDTPGSISVDGDMASQYAYVQINLFLKIDDYVDAEYDIDYGRLGEHLGAAVHALRKYFHGRFR